MEKTLLLAKSNLRKNRGTSIGLFLMMMIASALIGVSLLVFLDLYPTGSKEAKRLNAGDGYISIRYDLNGFTDEKNSLRKTPTATKHTETFSCHCVRCRLETEMSESTSRSAIRAHFPERWIRRISS